jgi:hypothetical protein
MAFCNQIDPMADTSRSPLSTILNMRFLNQLNEAELLSWLSRNSKNLLYALGALIAFLFIFYQFSSRSNSRAEADYIRAANAYALFAKGKEETDSLNELIALMKKYPELQAAYDGPVAQALLNQNQWAEAKPLALAALKRTASDSLGLYAQFAKISLVVADQKYEEALVQAQAFQEQLASALNGQVEASETVGLTELFALNLIRIGMLQQQLGNKEGELHAWQQWKIYAGLESSGTTAVKINPAAFRALTQQLGQGSISFADYLAYRQQSLVEK